MNRWAVVFAFALLLLAVALGLWMPNPNTGPRAPKPPPFLWEVPDFKMTAVTAEGSFPLTRNKLMGRPWVADFIFTRCTGPCPLMTRKMAALQDTLPRRVRLVSFSVDPDHDTKKVLQQYAKTNEADPARWFFVLGDKAEMVRLIVQGLKLGLNEEPAESPGARFTHSTKFMLVDSSGTIRGFYDSLDEKLTTALTRDAETL